MWVRFISTAILTITLGITLWITDAQAVYAAPQQVINGVDVAEDEQPWMVGLLLADVDDTYGAQFCGGTLVHAEWVMTAAHCTFDLDYSPFAAQELEIMVGSRYLRNGAGVRVAVDRIVRHNNFDFATYHNDIALLHLAEPLHQFATVAIAGSVMETDNLTASVFGWGVTENGVGAKALKTAELPVVDHKVCADFYQAQGYVVAETMVCAGYLTGGVDACAGDSGGPLMVWQEEYQQWVQAGIVSAGAGCAEPGYYGLYTQIADYVDWIAEMVDGRPVEDTRMALSAQPLLP